MSLLASFHCPTKRYLSPGPEVTNASAMQVDRETDRTTSEVKGLGYDEVSMARETLI
jgi:hypothetical protein